MKPNAALYHDFQNVGLSAEQIPIFHQRLIEKYNLLICKVYNTWGEKYDLLAKILKHINFKMLHAPSGKNAVDDSISKDLNEDISLDQRINEVILITGDKDFLPFVKKTKELGIKATLIYRSANASKKLINAVDQAYDIDELLSYPYPIQTVAKGAIKNSNGNLIVVKT